MRKPFTDEQLRQFLAMYDDEYSYNRIAQITKRSVKEVHIIYDDMFLLQYQYAMKYGSVNSLALICCENGKRYKNASEAAKDTQKARHLITCSAMFGFAIDNKHYMFDEVENGK